MRRAAELNPNHLDTRVNIGFFLLEADSPGEALREFEVLEQVAPEDWRVRFGRAEALQKLGRDREAAARWREFLATAPDGQYARRAQEMLDQIEGGGPSSR